MFGIAIAITVGILWLLAFISFPWWAPRVLDRMSKLKGPALECGMRLDFIAFAKQAYLRDHPGSDGTRVALANMQQYVGLPDITVCTNCPLGGTISVNPVGQLPTCSIAEHQEVFGMLYSSRNKDTANQVQEDTARKLADRQH